MLPFRLAGADSYLHRRSDRGTIVDAVRRTACGDRVWDLGVERAAASAIARPGCAGLTARELEVLTLKRHRHVVGTPRPARMRTPRICRGLSPRRWDHQPMLMPCDLMLNDGIRHELYGPWRVGAAAALIRARGAREAAARGGLPGALPGSLRRADRPGQRRLGRRPPERGAPVDRGLNGRIDQGCPAGGDCGGSRCGVGFEVACVSDRLAADVRECPGRCRGAACCARWRW
jgi:hypothetical protein